ncbi:MAG: hypothetical protein ABL931_14145 [Usitatibacteraceae bacterium]
MWRDESQVAVVTINLKENGEIEVISSNEEKQLEVRRLFAKERARCENGWLHFERTSGGQIEGRSFSQVWRLSLYVAANGELVVRENRSQHDRVALVLHGVSNSDQWYLYASAK